MYRKLEGLPKMSRNEISEAYPENFVLVRMEHRDKAYFDLEPLYIGDNFSELFGLQYDLEDSLLVIVEGLNIMIRNSWGGIVRVP